jgi:hypothetical protein
MLDLSTAFRKTGRQVSCDLDGEAAILHLEQSVYFGLKGVGARIWAALETPQSLPALSRMVCEEFDVDAEHCSADLKQFLGELEVAGLVERQPA